MLPLRTLMSSLMQAEYWVYNFRCWNTDMPDVTGEVIYSDVTGWLSSLSPFPMKDRWERGGNVRTIHPSITRPWWRRIQYICIVHIDINRTLAILFKTYKAKLNKLLWVPLCYYREEALIDIFTKSFFQYRSTRVSLINMKKTNLACLHTTHIL